MIFLKLYYDKRLKDPTYYVQQGIRNGNKTTTKNVKRIGKHSELLKITDNPLEYAKEEIKGKVFVKVSMNLEDPKNSILDRKSVV